jgi:outer membrane protein OmpA-like peptidoglycan-associated protein
VARGRVGEGSMNRPGTLLIAIGLLLVGAPSGLTAENQPDLSGSWRRGDGGVVAVSQHGDKITMVHVEVTPQVRSEFEFEPGDEHAVGTLEGRSFHGQMHVHLMHRMKTICPKEWDRWATLELTLSDDGNTLEGRWQNEHFSDRDCSFAFSEWIPWKYARVTEEPGRIRVVLDEVILFDFDRYDLKADGESALAKIKAAVIDDHPRARLVVEGHTDIRGSVDYNLTLSTRRAEAVAAWLKGHGVSAARLEIRGYGKSRPKYPGTSEENHARNRRVEIVVVDEGSVRP